MTESLFESKVKALLKNKSELCVFYFGQRKLYYDNEYGDWVVRGGQEEQNKKLYSGSSINVALVVLEKGLDEQ